MKALSLKSIAEAVGGRLIGEDRQITSVSTDTRKLSTGCLFIALKGIRFDGHDYVKSAAQNGATAIMAQQEMDVSLPQILVEDTGVAYMSLAAYYRSTFAIPVVAITGSVGKTSTREMVAAAIGIRFHVHKNEGNLNNDVGVPATILSLDEGYTAGVYEIGMNHAGEIRNLSKVVRPDMAVITNVGVSHIESLESRENILSAKLEILDGMKEGTPLVVNVDNDLLATVRYPNLITYGINVPADYTAQDIETTENGIRFSCVHKGVVTPVNLPVVGIHNVYNALAAIAVAGQFNISPEETARGLMDYHNIGLRQHIEHVGKLTLIEDCYNASPDSMKAGLDTLRTIAKHRRIAVLGDMLELGTYADEAHRVVGEYAASRADLVLTCGEKAALIAERAAESTKALHFDAKEELAACLPELLSDGDTILFKASRGMKFEDLIEVVRKTTEE